MLLSSTAKWGQFDEMVRAGKAFTPSSVRFAIPIAKATSGHLTSGSLAFQVLPMPLIAPHCMLGCGFAIVSNTPCMNSAYIARPAACCSADSD